MSAVEAWTDFIGDFMSLTEGAQSPDLFRKWSAISTVAGALERRVWAKAGDRPTFANMYVLLVAPPGVGKQIIDDVHELWQDAMEPGSKTPAFRVAPDNTSKAALMDTLAKAKQIRLSAKGPAITYHSLLVAAEEIQVLMPTFDPEYIGALNKIFNNPPSHSEARRHGPVRELRIDQPQLNILAGAQPSYFISTFPEEAWSTGLIRRIIMVYSAESRFQDLFTFTEGRDSQHRKVLKKLGFFSTLYGQMQWTPDAAASISAGHKTGFQPEPKHSKLAHYLRSRTMFVIKLAMISAVSRTGQLVIDEIDIKRSVSWLLEVEQLMPDIFREMIGKSDAQVIEETHYYVMREFARGKSKPVTGDRIMQFLLQRTPSEKAEKIMLMMDRAGLVVRVAGSQDLFVPRPRHEAREVE